MHIDLYASSLRTYRLYGVHVYVHEKEKKEKIIIIKKRKKKKKHVYLHIHTASDHYSVVRSAPPFIQWGTIYLLKNNAQQFDQRRISFVIFLKDYRAIVLVS